MTEPLFSCFDPYCLEVCLGSAPPLWQHQCPDEWSLPVEILLSYWLGCACGVSELLPLLSRPGKGSGVVFSVTKGWLPVTDCLLDLRQWLIITAIRYQTLILSRYWEELWLLTRPLLGLPTSSRATHSKCVVTPTQDPCTVVLLWSCISSSLPSLPCSRLVKQSRNRLAQLLFSLIHPCI